MHPQTVQSLAILSAARDLAQRVAAAWPVHGAMLFGSHARGNASAGSDTDVAVLLHGDSDGLRFWP